MAFLWDESFLWGLMAYKTMRGLGLPFDLLRSEDIRNGCLQNYRMLFVPGGWASNKLKALGEKGAEEIKRFVYEGGNYFGICGGAGLATMDGLGLLKIKRKPTKERVPSFSGRIKLNIKRHPLFEIQDSRFKIQDGVRHSLQIFHAWWPSQFIVNDKDSEILATFGDALPDSYSSDLKVGDVREKGEWSRLEKLYGINLDPERLKDEPAVVEGRFGKGTVLLSLIHFDTPEDENGTVVLKNIWEYLGNEYNLLPIAHHPPITHHPSLLLQHCSEIIDFGIRRSLWFWRTPMILQWRRGVRGLEYNTLYVMAKEIAEAEEYLRLNGDFFTFKEKVLRLLMLEGREIQEGIKIDSYSTGDHLDPEIQALRKELFGDSKSHGGLFKEILDIIDHALYESLRQCYFW